MQNPIVIINGKQADAVSSLDRGFLYGDGVFETVAVKHGKLQYWADHLERLNDGCKALNLHGLDVSVLEQEIQQLLSADASQDKCVVKIIVTRGVGGRGYKPSKQTLTRVVQKFPWPEHPASFIETGIKVTLCEFRLSQQSRLAKIKHLNRLEQALARSEWDDEFQEGLVCDADDNIIEATSNNVFLQIEDKLVTPMLNQCGVAGVMRKQIIEYCRLKKITIEIRNFKLSEMNQVQSMFLCNSINSIWPVRSYCERKLSKTAIIDQLVAVFNS
jgi:4-amino-4-deoxychorismate lyase